VNHAPIPAEDEELAHKIIGAAIEVHRILGPGFLESVYEKALEHELKSRGLPVARQQELVVNFKDLRIEGQRLDLIVGGRIIVELKAIDTVPPIHQAKLLSYLKAADLRLGLIINFNVTVLKDGFQRMVR
jgi:GxxExxY protein